MKYKYNIQICSQYFVQYYKTKTLFSMSAFQLWKHIRKDCEIGKSGWYTLRNNLWCITLQRNYSLSWPILIKIP